MAPRCVPVQPGALGARSQSAPDIVSWRPLKAALGLGCPRGVSRQAAPEKKADQPDGEADAFDGLRDWLRGELSSLAARLAADVAHSADLAAKELEQACQKALLSRPQTSNVEVGRARNELLQSFRRLPEEALRLAADAQGIEATGVPRPLPPTITSVDWLGQCAAPAAALRDQLQDLSVQLRVLAACGQEAAAEMEDAREGMEDLREDLSSMRGQISRLEAFQKETGIALACLTEGSRQHAEHRFSEASSWPRASSLLCGGAGRTGLRRQQSDDVDCRFWAKHAVPGIGIEALQAGSNNGSTGAAPDTPI